MIDTFLAVGKMLEGLGYKELSSYLTKFKEDSFLKSCVGVILNKTPLENINSTLGNLYVCGAIDDAP